ncbi:MAG TPA: sugar phosphate isomerase/epimerase [Clostridiales bacterium]|nr:sugar phosphate isomerase/epimerase [Clostridiales bacterium]
MGYDGVELAGTYGLTFGEVKETLANVGLVPISAHVPYAQLVEDLENTVYNYSNLGCQYIVVPYLVEEDRPEAGNFDKVVDNIRKIAEHCKTKDVTLLYHNHDFEFVRMEDGRYALDYLYDSISADLLKTEIDTCWVKVAGEDPVEYLKKYAGRSPIVHIKDFVGGKNEIKFAFKAVGYGVQDVPAIVEASIEVGAEWVVVEQDMHYENTPLEDARISIDYLSKLL